MKWLGYLAAAIAAFVVVAFALVLVIVDAEEVARATANDVAARLGQPVTHGPVDLSWLPSPAIQLQDVRVGSPEPEPLLTAASARLSISLLGLFMGETALGSIELDRPNLRLELDADGRPVLPAIAAGTAADAGAPPLWITSLRIRDGKIALGPWTIENVQVSGGANFDLSADFDISAELPGIAALREGNVEVVDFRDGKIRWAAVLPLVDVDIAGVREQLAPGRAIWGKGDITLEMTGEAGELRSGKIDVALRPLDFRSDILTINGDVVLKAALGESFVIDLTGSEVSLADVLQKPVGAEARAEGKLASDLALRELRDWTLELGDSELRGTLRLSGDAPEVELAGDLDLESLGAWTQLPRFPSAGRLAIERLSYTERRGAVGEGRAQGVVVPVTESQSIILNGPVFIDGTVVGGRDLGLELLGETFTLSGSYDIARQSVNLSAAATGVELSGFSEALGGKARITGKLYARADIQGPAQLPDLTGQGEFEIPGGEMTNASIESFLRDEGATPSGVTPFRRIAGRFVLRNRQLEFSELVHEQNDASVSLTGTLSLVDGSVNLTGDARFFRGSEVVENGLTVEGPLFALRGRLGKTTPEELAKQRSIERRMLQSMKNVMLERGIPEDPQLAKEFREMLQNIDKELAAKPPLGSEDDLAFPEDESGLPEEELEAPSQASSFDELQAVPVDPATLDVSEDPVLDEMDAGFE